MRRILPSQVDGFAALPSGSFWPPPSPKPMYSKPSGPNCRLPPLWFEYGWRWVSTVRAVRVFTRVAPGRLRNSTTRVLPRRSV